MIDLKWWRPTGQSRLVGDAKVSLMRFGGNLAVYRFRFLLALFQRFGLSVGKVPAGAMLSERALNIWHERPDLQFVFDLRLSAGRAGLFWWYLLHAYREMGLGFDENSRRLIWAVSRPLPGVVRHDLTPVTWLIREVGRRSGMQVGTLRNKDSQRELLAWFFTKGIIDRRLGDYLTLEQAAALIAPDPHASGLPWICSLIWHVEPQLNRQFTGLKDPAFLAWCHGEGARRFPILSHPHIAFAAPWSPSIQVSGRLGVNLIGHAFGRSGLSEDVRAAALTLTAAGVPFAIHDASAGAAFGEEDMSLVAHVTHDLPYDVNLFCLTGPSTVAAVLGSELSRDRRYSIGMWPWELPEWPDFWRHAYGFVDEIWASSRFTYDAYCRSAPIPVRHMPMAVSVNATEGAKRLDFGLAPDKFLFAFAFDGLSTFTRKNPEACIAAFQRAFPAPNDAVGLVIKGLRAEGNSAWDRLSARIKDDPRITLITESLSRGQLLDLYRAIDCFVSLHRSEGFGRNIAEAMQLERPVIVTAHSGNMDFTTFDTAALVPVSLVPLAQGDYPFGTGQMWAEADVDVAARLMQRMVTDVAWRQRIARAGRVSLEEAYSPYSVGARWLEILRSLRGTSRDR